VHRVSFTAVIIRRWGAKEMELFRSSLFSPGARGSVRRDEESMPRDGSGNLDAWGNSCDGMAQCAKAGSQASGFLLPHPAAGGAASVVIFADLVSSTAVLMVTFTASSIGSLKGTSIRSSPCS